MLVEVLIVVTELVPGTDGISITSADVKSYSDNRETRLSYLFCRLVGFTLICFMYLVKSSANSQLLLLLLLVLSVVSSLHFNGKSCVHIACVLALISTSLMFDVCITCNNNNDNDDDNNNDDDDDTYSYSSIIK